jgi:tetrahydrodipicolinate N-succinyltransferase
MDGLEDSGKITITTEVGIVGVLEGKDRNMIEIGINCGIEIHVFGGIQILGGRILEIHEVGIAVGVQVPALESESLVVMGQ